MERARSCDFVSPSNPPTWAKANPSRRSRRGAVSASSATSRLPTLALRRFRTSGSPLLLGQAASFCPSIRNSPATDAPERSTSARLAPRRSTLPPTCANATAALLGVTGVADDQISPDIQGVGVELAFEAGLGYVERSHDLRGGEIHILLEGGCPRQEF